MPRYRMVFDFEADDLAKAESFASIIGVIVKAGIRNLLGSEEYTFHGVRALASRPAPPSASPSPSDAAPPESRSVHRRPDDESELQLRL